MRKALALVRRVEANQEWRRNIQFIFS
jgi:hypothetical protein